MKKLIIAAAIIVLLVVGIVLAVLYAGKAKLVAVDPAPVQQPIALIDGRQCYAYSHDATENEPYTNEEFIDMTITGAKVTGTKKGTQTGPDMSNGYEGTITGTLSGDTINVGYAYTVEGSKNTEQEIYKASLTGIDKLQYPLIDRYKEGLVPDTSKEYTARHYSRVGCEASN